MIESGEIMDLKDIKAIIDLMKKNSISEFELEKQEFKIRLKRSANGGAAHLPQVEDMGTGFITASGSPQLPTQTSVASASNEIEIKSPMVGTFYRAPSPEAAN